jgi:TP901 family phage tail tape measure protein
VADRTVVIRLRAEIGDFESKMARARRATEDQAKAGKRLTSETAQQLSTLGAPVAAAGAAMAGGFGLAVKAAADFEKEMSGVRAVSNASAEDMQRLRDAALDAGAKTSFSASQAAQAQAELAKAGISTADILGGALAGSLDLAAAGQLDLGNAATISAQAMNIFKLEGQDVGRIANVLAAGANKSAADVGQLGDALRQGGLLAAQTGLSLEETVGALSAFADNALIGSDAGTSLKTMLQTLNPTSEKAAGLMADIGFNAYDAQGNFIGLEGLARELTESFGGMTVEQRNAAMATIFGSDAVRAANILYEQGESGIRDYVSAVNDQGAAARMASTQLDNLAGDFEALQGSIETALIKSGSAANSLMREGVQGATGLVNAYNELPGPLQTAVTLIGGVGGAAGVAAGGFLLMLPRIVETRAAMAALTASSATAAGAVATLGLAARGAGVAAGLFAIGWAVTELDKDLQGLLGNGPADVKALSDSLSEFASTGRVTGELARQLGDGLSSFDESLRRLTDRNTFEKIDDAAQGAWTWLVTLNGLLGEEAFGTSGTPYRLARQDLEELDAVLAGMVTGGNIEGARRNFEALSAHAQAQGKSVASLTEQLPSYTAALDAAGTKTENLVTVTDSATGAIRQLTPEQAEAAAATEEHARAMEEFAKTLDAFSSPLGVYQQALQAKQDKERESFEATQKEAGKGAEAIAEFQASAELSLQEYAAAFERDNEAQRNWQANLSKIAGRGAEDVAMTLANMGEEGARLTAQLADASGGDFERLATAMRENTRLGTTGAATELDKGMQVLKALGDRGGKDTVAALTAQLRAGTITLAEIAAQYGHRLTGGMNPILEALGKQPLSPRVQGPPGSQARPQANGSVLDFYANGGIESHVAQIAPAGAWRVWAEPETGGEAYIPLAPSKRQRSRLIAQETVRRLGGVAEFATGGFFAAGDVPRPPSTAPFRPPISTAADGTMNAGYRALVDALGATFAPEGGSGPFSVAADGELSSNAAAAKKAVLARFGPMTIGGWGRRPNPTEHDDYINGRKASRALDFMTSNLALGNAIAEMMHSFPGATYSIWNRRIRRVGGGWRPYSGRSPHTDHVHTSFLVKGGILNPHVRDEGGPLLPGFTYNGTGRPEMVLPMAEGGVVDAAALGGGMPAVLARVAAIFGNRGVAIATALEAAEQRLRRIGDDLLRGVRTFADVRRSVDLQTGGGVRAVSGRLTPFALPTTVDDAQQRIAEYQQQVEELDRIRERESLLAEMRVTNAEWSRVEAAFRASRDEDERARLMQEHGRLSEEGARQRERLGQMNQQEARAERLLQLERQLADVRAAAERSEAAEALARNRLADLRQMLAEQRRVQQTLEAARRQLRDRLVEAQEQYATRIADAQRRLNESVAQARRDLRGRIADMTRARADELRGWAQLSEPVSIRWGNTVGALTRNVNRQIGLFEEWTARLAEARQRGVSETAIRAFGLDQGPESLGQLREFSRASATEIAALNAAVARQQALADSQARREAGNGVTRLGESLIAAREETNEQLARLHADFAESQRGALAGLREQRVAANADFAESQRQANAALAAIGHDGALAYGQAIARGLASSIPEIQAQARLAQEAMRGLSVDTRSRLSGDADLTARVRAIFKNRGVRIGTAQESEAARLARIVGEVKAGRSLNSVRQSVDWIRSTMPGTPVTAASAGGAGSPVRQTVVVQLDGRTIARNTTSWQTAQNRTLTIKAGQ